MNGFKGQGDNMVLFCRRDIYDLCDGSKSYVIAPHAFRFEILNAVYRYLPHREGDSIVFVLRSSMRFLEGDA
jgi:hypothetical protein